MKITRHGEYLVQLTRYPRVFPVSVYLVREDDGFTLVDAGMSGSERDILEAARGLGGEIRRVAITHSHADHVGSLDALREALRGVEVLVPATATWDLSVALESARRLRALEPSRLAVGHGPVLEGPDAEMDRAIREAEGRAEKMGKGSLLGVA